MEAEAWGPKKGTWMPLLRSSLHTPEQNLHGSSEKVSHSHPSRLSKLQGGASRLQQHTLEREGGKKNSLENAYWLRER